MHVNLYKVIQDLNCDIDRMVSRSCQTTRTMRASAPT